MNITTDQEYEEVRDAPFTPNWVSPPGNTIEDYLQEKGLTPTWFAQQMGMSKVEAFYLLIGETAITEPIAQKLEAVTGASVQFWLNREKHYREGLIRISDNDRTRLISDVTD